MRVILAGRSGNRARLKDELDRLAIAVVAEFDTLADAQAAAIPADAIVLADADGRAATARRDGGDEWFEEPLTPREIEVLQLLAEGLPNKAIAERLRISDQTVKFHVGSIFGKLGASNRTDAVRRALRRGLISV
jgi:DNA-binding NarL/FixJ family response regulator